MQNIKEATLSDLAKNRLRIRSTIEFPGWEKLNNSEIKSWYRIVKHSDFNSFAELRQAFLGADKVDNLTVFNIGGNKARLIAAIHYNTRRIYIRHVLTHKEYDRENRRK